MPDWEAALDRFRLFLDAAGHPTSIVWLFREDFYSPSLSRHFVRWPLPDSNGELARGRYEGARRRGHGVGFRAQFGVEGESTTAASLFVPAELWRDAAHAGGELGISAAAPLPSATPVRNRLAWWLHRKTGAYRLNLRQGFDIPLRAGNG